MDNLKLIRELIKTVSKGSMAYDIMHCLLNDPQETLESDADSLFRTLVLDENVSVEDAKEVYYEVSDFLENNI